MAVMRTLQASFSGGEVTPEFFGRIDDPKYQSGAATMRNFIALPHGPASNRAGFSYVRATKDSGSKKSRMLPFVYSTTQTYAIEIGEGYFRFHTNGATLLCPAADAWVTATTYTVGDLVSSGGTNYYCLTPHLSGATLAGDIAYWYAEPATGEYEIPNSYLEADLFDIHYVQSADVMTLVHPSYAPAELRRYGATNWTHSGIGFVPLIYPPGRTTTAPNAIVHTYKVSAYTACMGFRAAPFDSSTCQPGEWISNPSAAFTCNNDLTLAGAYNTLTWDPSEGATAYYVWKLESGSYYLLGIAPSTSFVDSSALSVNTSVPIKTTAPTWTAPAGYAATATTQAGTVASVTVTPNAVDVTYTYNYVVTSVLNGEESSASSIGQCTNNLFTSGRWNTITWPPVAGVERYKIYKESNGIYGYIGDGVNGVTGFRDDNIAADLSRTPPIYANPFIGPGNYPGAVSYFEQRRIFAGSVNYPQNIWMTRSGTESNLSTSIPTRDDDAIIFRVAAREANTIRHLVPLGNLVPLTGSAEWRVTSVNSDALTPTSVVVRPQSYVGANNVQPVIINNNLVYGAARGGHVRELSYNWQANGYLSGDLSMRAPHLFDGLNVTDMAYGKAPFPVVWFVSSNGKLLGLTYVPEQQVGAWHWHDTDGLFESVCVVAEGDEDALYAVIKRTINGSVVRYIERMGSRLFDTLEDAYFVDCGLTYDGNNTTATTVTVTGGTTWGPAETLTITASVAIFAFPAQTDVGDAIVLTDAAGNKYTLTIQSTTSTTVATAKVDVTLAAALRGVATTVWGFARDTVSGLSHLEGKTISILADGAVHPQKVVTSGSVALDAPAVVVQAGLPITADLQTLPITLALKGDGSYGQSRFKNINKAWLRVHESSGIWVGPNADNLTEAKQRTTEPYGSPPALKSALIDVMVTPSWGDSGQVYIRQTDPLPLTITSLSLEVAVGG